MIDVFLPWGADLTAGPTGDIALASTADTIAQRIGRRLLTAGGAYIWQLDYGASLGSFVGLPADPTGIEGVIRSQIALETAVPAIPVPEINVSMQDRANGIVVATITYADPTSMAPVAVNIALPSDLAA